MRTLHERSVDRRQTLIQVKSKSTLHGFKKTLSNSSVQPLWLIHVLDDATGGGVSGVQGAVCYQRFGCPDMDAHTSRFEPLSYV
jgi:hypothetical protein